MKKILIIFALITIYSTTYANLTGSHFDQANNFYANVFCFPYIGPTGLTVFLGEFFTGGEYTSFINDEQEFTLKAGEGMEFIVTTTTSMNDHGVTIDFEWSENSSGSWVPYGTNNELLNLPVIIPQGSDCETTVLFKCKVKKLIIPSIGISASMKTFNMRIDATLTAY